MRTVEEAAKILKDAYTAAIARREQALSVHLFAIRYADEIKTMPLDELLERAGMPASYATELRKGIALSQYVEVKT